MTKNQDFATYDVGHIDVGIILLWLKQDKINIPELQRPFVWKSKQIKQFIESLYHGHPIGFIVTYDKPSMPLKGSKIAKSGSKIIIDGQQRIKALQSVVLQGKPIVNEKWKEINPKVAFNPQNEDGEFAISSSRHTKDPKWIEDVGPIIENPSDPGIAEDGVDSFVAMARQGILEVKLELSGFPALYEGQTTLLQLSIDDGNSTLTSYYYIYLKTPLGILCPMPT